MGDEHILTIKNRELHSAEGNPAEKLFEGFSMPGIESIRAGLAVVAAGIYIAWMIIEKQSVINLLCVIMLAVLLVMAFTMQYGNTVVTAIVMGLLLAILTGRTGYVGIFGATSLLASLFWPLGRMFCATAFLFGAMGLGILYEPELLYEMVPSLLAGTVLFFFVPGSWLKSLRQNLGTGRAVNYADKQEKIDKKEQRLKNTVCEQARRWQDLSDSFKGVDIYRDFFGQAARAFRTFEPGEKTPPRIRIVSGVSRTVGSSDFISGDNYSFDLLENNRMLIMLSDGMGSGVQAYHDSDQAISRVEQLMEAGFTITTALSLLQQWLLAKSREDVGTTVDAASVDLVNGECTLVKAGAAASFLLRRKTAAMSVAGDTSGWNVQLMNAESMPLGIFEELHAGKLCFTLKSGDILIMMTDGVLDGLSGEMKEERMKGFLEFETPKISHAEPERQAQTLAAAIMDFAVSDSSREENRDDMTVLVLVVV